MQESRSRGLLRLRHLREVTEARGEEMEREAERFRALADPSAAPRAVSAFNLFQTPEPIADRMVRLADLADGLRVLEPSAGLGRIYRAIRCRSSCSVHLVELDNTLAGELYRETQGDDAARLSVGDFLEFSGGPFDRVIMNPPFKMGRDIKHIRHALGLLAPGGFVVSLCFDGVRQREQLQPLAASWEPLPAESFKAEGTRAGVVLATFRP